MDKRKRQKKPKPYQPEKFKMEKQEKEISVKIIPNEVFSRVVGYYRPVQHWNEGKQEEYRERNSLSIERGKDAENNTQ